MKSIRNKILVCMLLSVFISLVAVGGVSAWLNYRGTINTLHKAMVEIGELSIMISAPIWEGGVPGSKIWGVVYFVPAETFLNDIVAGIQVSPHGSAYILNKEGYTIAHQNIDNVKNRENTQVNAKTDKKLSQLAALEKSMTQGGSGFGQYEYGGVRKFLAFSPIDGTDGWSLGVNAPPLILPAPPSGGFSLQ